MATTTVTLGVDDPQLEVVIDMRTLAEDYRKRLIRELSIGRLFRRRLELPGSTKRLRQRPGLGARVTGSICAMSMPCLENVSELVYAEPAGSGTPAIDQSGTQLPVTGQGVQSLNQGIDVTRRKPETVHPVDKELRCTTDRRAHDWKPTGHGLHGNQAEWFIPNGRKYQGISSVHHVD